MSDPIVVEKFAIGQSVRRVEDPRLVQGYGRYSDDVNLSNQAYAFIVRSPHAHAAIRSIDTSAARRASGVLGVFTGEDLAKDKLGKGKASDLQFAKGKTVPDKRAATRIAQARSPVERGKIVSEFGEAHGATGSISAGLICTVPVSTVEMMPPSSISAS